MKKKGFTLIELLAVIVVLAIIALIATPIVMNTIKKSQKGAAERSAENYIDAVETAVATAKLDSDGVPDGTYQIDSEGNLTGEGLPDGKLTIEMNGNKPKSGTITIKNGQVTTDSKMTVGSYEVAYNQATKKYEAAENSSASPTVVYRYSTDKINIGDTMDDPTKYTKDASTLEKAIYLKHVLDKDNKVLESYSCIRYNNKEACIKGGVTDFYGWVDEESKYTGNLLVLYGLKNEGFDCYLSDSDSYCMNYDYGIYIDANPDGYAGAEGNGNCYVMDDRSSNCLN